MGRTSEVTHGSFEHFQVPDHASDAGACIPAFDPTGLSEKLNTSWRGPVRNSPFIPWHLDEVVIGIGGETHWLWRAVDQDSFVSDVLVQSRRNAKAAKRLMRKRLK
jgi:hypothetical protein